MAREAKYLLSDNQDFANTTSTGEVTDNVYDMETKDGSAAIITDDQGLGWFNISFNTVPAQATIAGTEGLLVSILTDSAAALTTLPKTIGSRSFLPGDIIAGRTYAIPVMCDKLEKYVGGWAKALSTSFVGTIYVDIEPSDHPIGLNAEIQKMPS